MKYDKKKPDLLPDEPWFLIRGRDALAVQAISAYADLARDAGVREFSDALIQHGLQCLKVVHRFPDWQEANKDKVRMPKPERRRQP